MPDASRSVAVLFLSVALSCSSALAQSSDAPSDEAGPALLIDVDEIKRPRVLIPLYVSAAVLGTLDVTTTLHAHSHGAEEVNPLLSGMEDHPWHMAAVKSLAIGVTLWSAEEMWKNGHPKLAIATMILVNSITAAVVINNLHVITVQEGLIAAPPAVAPAPPRPGTGVDVRLLVRFGGHGLQWSAGR